ncbi:MAG: BamA/TamA family outer membrane protein [Enhygromyxa sp.]
MSRVQAQRGRGRSPKVRIDPASALAVLVSVALGGCRPELSAAELRGAEYTVRKVEFEGVTRFREGELYDYLELRPLSWRPLPTRHWYYEGLLPIDAERIVELYRAHGYYEARVVDVRVEIIERRRRSRVDIFYVIDEGPVTKVDELVVRWPEGPPPGPPASERRGVFAPLWSLEPEQISQAVTLALGEAFEVPKLLSSAAALRERLRRLGHPFVEIEQEARVDPLEQSAAVEFEVRPGPFMRIGELEVVGLETVPLRPILAELEGVRGRPYSPARIEEIERRVYALGVFSTVAVEPEPRALAEDGELDLVVRVRERDPQRVRLGVALGFEPNRWEQRFAARYEHANLFRHLYKLRLTGRVGYAEIPSVVRPLAHGPVLSVDLRGEKKGLLERLLVWTVEPTFELGIEQGYQFYSVRHRFGVSRFFTRWFQAELSHNLRFVDFFAVSPTLESSETLLGPDYRDPYILSHLDMKATIWGVDNFAAPNDGVVLGVEYRVAGGPLGGQFDYQEVSPFVRGYWRPIERLQLAVRGRVEMIFPFGDQPGAPIDMRQYLGGVSTVRGWGRRRLSPRVDDCEPGQSPVTGACESIPVGGNTTVLGNFELRVLTWNQLWVAGFVDLGDVQPGIRQFEPSQWNYSAGGGLRYASPVGKFRLDLGVRLNETEASRGEPGWAIHFSLGEAF